VRALGAETGAALEEQQPGQAGRRPVRRDHLPGEHLDLLATGPVMVERDGEAVVGEHGADLAVAGHDQHGTAAEAGGPGRVFQFRT
jgi:hypothetical protein